MVRVFDVETGKPISPEMVHDKRKDSDNRVTMALFTHSDEYVVTTSGDGMAKIWDHNNGRMIAEPLLHRPNADLHFMAFNNKGDRLLTVGDEDVKIWDWQTGRPIGQPLHHNEEMWRASFSPDGKKMVTACFDGTARIWDAVNGEAIGRPLVHNETVRVATFSSHGARILTAGDDGLMRLWDAETGSSVSHPHVNQTASAPLHSAIMIVMSSLVGAMVPSRFMRYPWMSAQSLKLRDSED